MPEGDEQPVAKKRVTRKKKAEIAPAAPAPAAEEPPKLSGIDAIRAKYRLDKDVNLYSRNQRGERMGKGSIIDDQVFDKLAELDPTKNKKYLDWMLFQAGGGSDAFKKSRENWGDGKPEKTPDEFFKEFAEARPNHTISFDEIKSVAQKLKDKGLDYPGLYTHVPEEIERLSQIPDIVQRYNAIRELLIRKQICPGREGRVSLELIGNKFKVWTKQQLGTFTRDRVHAVSVYSRIIRGVPREEAEAKWKEMEERRRHEYIFGDQDSLKFEAFGFNRHWPGRNNIYETVYNAMRQFLLNKERVDSYNERLDAYNQKVIEKNKTLPPDQQVPTREAMRLNMDIGKVLVDAQGNLSYKGSFPTVYDLTAFNEMVSNLPLRERVTRDIRYSVPKGTQSRTGKLYTDENVDVVAPLTIAAAIEAGDPHWKISNPEQLSNIKSQGSYSLTDWSNYTSGKHGHVEWDEMPAIPIFFHLKTRKDPTRLWATVFLDDLVDLTPPYVATIWRTTGSAHGTQMTFSQMIKYLQKTAHRDGQSRESYAAMVRSIGNGMKAVREWGKEYNPQEMVSDYIQHHRERLTTKRTLGEDVKIRATQIVEALCE